MEYKTLLKANFKRHKGGFFGVFILISIVSLALGTVLSVWISAGRYIESEMSRAGFGDITAWVSGLPDTAPLEQEITALDEISEVEKQRVIFTNYESNGVEGDSEGQLIEYVPADNRYRFFSADLSGYTEAPVIERGTVYVSPSLVSMMNIKPDDSISFKIAREGGSTELTVAGFYEDCFMGSSMIGMKGFLINADDFSEISYKADSFGINALARSGAMLHIFAAENSRNIMELNGIINDNTAITNYAEFVHTKSAIKGFMLILHNAFCAILTAFVAVLLIVALAVLGHSISATIEADYTDMGILKTVGLTSGKLRSIQLIQYISAVMAGIIIGVILSVPLSSFVDSATLTTTGVLIPSNLPVPETIGAFAAILAVIALFIMLKTAKIKNIPPITAIQGGYSGEKSVKAFPKISGKNLAFSLAMRQLFTGKRMYISACIVAVLLTFFASLVGRMNSWLGADGKGMMDAFNPADHDIGVQSFGSTTTDDFEEIIRKYTEITAIYKLAMPNASLCGVDFTVNVIDEPERFHIISGKSCFADNEIVVTEFIAANFGLKIGDTVTVSANKGSAEFIISGVYSCANDMGDNLGMSEKGYLKIGRGDPRIWCWHYFLADPNLKYDITAELEDTFGGDVHVHENTWPGLFGIISAMHILLIFMYAVVLIFILIVTTMTGNKILSNEQKNLGIYKSLGFTSSSLRMTFATRFGAVALLGGIIGTLLAALFTDPLVSAVMKLAGISNFASNPNIFEILLPAVIVIILFFAFGYLSAGKIKKTDLTILIAE